MTAELPHPHTSFTSLQWVLIKS